MHVLLGQEIREKIYKLLEAKKKKRENTFGRQFPPCIKCS